MNSKLRIPLCWKGLRAFASGFVPQSRFVSICQPDFSQAMTDIAKLVTVVLGSPCIDGDLDLTDIYPARPGMQIACSVADVPHGGTAPEAGSVIARCNQLDDENVDPSQPIYPCWWVKIDQTSCPSNISQKNVELHVERNGIAPPVNSHLVANCLSN